MVVLFPIISYLFHFLSLGAKVMIIAISSKSLSHFLLAEYSTGAIKLHGN